MVTLRAELVRCAVSSPGVSTGPLPSARVPGFVGRRLSAAAGWAGRHRLYWEADEIPPLAAGSAPSLLGNYRVTGQSPRPGATLKLGIGSGHGNQGRFLPTPLVLQVAGATGRLLSSPWTLIAVHGRRIKIDAQHMGCTSRGTYQFDHTTVTQTARHVTIAVYDRVTQLPKGYACSAVGYAPLKLTIRLSARLGGRALVHALVAPQAPTGP